jgi:hypothetical protein
MCSPSRKSRGNHLFCTGSRTFFDQTCVLGNLVREPNPKSLVRLLPLPTLTQCSNCACYVHWSVREHVPLGLCVLAFRAVTINNWLHDHPKGRTRTTWLSSESNHCFPIADPGTPWNPKCCLIFDPKRSWFS